jgi:hypothetical protein
MGEKRAAYKLLVLKAEGKRPIRRLVVDGRTILKQILNK